MSLYRNNFGFRAPYQILIDGTFCQVALQYKVNIQEQLPKYLSAECKLLTTACVIEEVKKLGKPLHGAYTILTQFATHNCGHEEPVSASKCLSSFVTQDKNKNHYLIATQDYNLRQKVTRLVICPTLKLANNALVLEKPTDKVQIRVEKRHNAIANHIRKHDVEVLNKLQELTQTDRTTSTHNDEPKKSRKGPKGPNPLSCKKSTKSKPQESDLNIDCGGKKTRRRRVKISRHVKKLLCEHMDNKNEVNT